MKRSKHLFFIPIGIALLAAIALIYTLLPSSLFVKASLAVLIPLGILTIGFRILGKYRIQIIQKQLHQILKTLEEFDVDEPQKVAFINSPFPVFNELNEYLIELINRIRDNYQANKQFTQNASHELQTPLAIIKGHIEILLQSPNIGEREIQSLGIALQNTNRLSKINSALILLSKIEHQRFFTTEKISFVNTIEEILRNFNDLIQIQELSIHKNYQADFAPEMSDTLAEILLANLVQNAIRHNIEDGLIFISISSNQFCIKNTGFPIDSPPTDFFKRFKRKSEVDESLGLGLSIVQRICEHSNLKITYTCEDNWHILVITAS